VDLEGIGGERDGDWGIDEHEDWRGVAAAGIGLGFVGLIQREEQMGGCPRIPQPTTSTDPYTRSHK
jgi:hypothetical protein